MPTRKIYTKLSKKIKAIREKAKALISADEKEKKIFFEKLRKMGFKVDSIGDVLSLNQKDYLRRRLQTVVADKKIAPTLKSARQMIAHKKIFVGGKNINSPSYLVPVEIENKITVKQGRFKEASE